MRNLEFLRVQKNKENIHLLDRIIKLRATLEHIKIRCTHYNDDLNELCDCSTGMVLLADKALKDDEAAG